MKAATLRFDDQGSISSIQIFSESDIEQMEIERYLQEILRPAVWSQISVAAPTAQSVDGCAGSCGHCGSCG